MATPGLVFRKSSAVGGPTNFTVLKINVPPTLAGNCLQLEIGSVDSGANPTVTDNKGNTWTVAASVVGTLRLCVLVATNMAAGTNLLTITYAAVANTIQIDYEEWANISQAAVATALDGTSSATFVSSGNSVPAGAIVTTVDGDLIRQWGENNANTDNSTTFTKGSGFTKVSSQISGTATNFDRTSVSQYQVQGTHGSINPTNTYSGALNTSDTVAIALKSAAAGTAPAAGIRVAGIQQFYALAGVASIKFEMPHVGNLIHISSENENVISGITDGDTNTYQTAAAGADRKLLPSGAFGAESWRAINLTPNTDLVTGVISFSVVLTVNTGLGAIYDVVGADTTQGTGGRVQTV